MANQKLVLPAKRSGGDGVDVAETEASKVVKKADGFDCTWKADWQADAWNAEWQAAEKADWQAAEKVDWQAAEEVEDKEAFQP